MNASVQIDMPRERWVLFAAGPRVGPAVLFWGVVIVILLVAVGLGRVRLTPLKPAFPEFGHMSDEAEVRMREVSRH